MSENTTTSKLVSAEREIQADAATLFELIADPSRQPEWDGNDNLTEAPAGQRVREAGGFFVMHTTKGKVKENHVVEFEEGRRIAWLTADAGHEPSGHLWRWELAPLDDNRTLVRHSYDWSALAPDSPRIARASSMTPEMLRASIDRLADVV